MKKLFSILLFSSIAFNMHGQELQAKLSLIANKVSSKVDKKIFQTLQSGLNNFLNNRKWGGHTYQPNEKNQV